MQPVQPDIPEQRADLPQKGTRYIFELAFKHSQWVVKERGNPAPWILLRPSVDLTKQAGTVSVVGGPTRSKICSLVVGDLEMQHPTASINRSTCMIDSTEWRDLDWKTMLKACQLNHDGQNTPFCSVDQKKTSRLHFEDCPFGIRRQISTYAMDEQGSGLCKEVSEFDVYATFVGVRRAFLVNMNHPSTKSNGSKNATDVPCWKRHDTCAFNACVNLASGCSLDVRHNMGAGLQKKRRGDLCSEIPKLGLKVEVQLSEISIEVDKNASDPLHVLLVGFALANYLLPSRAEDAFDVGMETDTSGHRTLMPEKKLKRNLVLNHA